MLKKIISGGQTGADQGALDAAMEKGFRYGGSIPAGRKTENGPLPSSYAMTVMSSAEYRVRTLQNIKDADGTLILSHGPLSGGSLLTLNLAEKLERPCLHINFSAIDTKDATIEARRWIRENRIETMNVAGPRASSDSRIHNRVRLLVLQLIEEASSHEK